MLNTVSLEDLAQQYSVGDLIGHGADASVYRADDRCLHRPVALKLYDQRVELDIAFVANFRREARQACDLEHPQVIQTLGYGYADEHYYLATEYIDGENLSQWLPNGAAPVSERVLGVFVDVCSGLQYIHRQGLLHRSVKPANILMRQSGEVLITGVQPLHERASSGLTVTLAAIGSIAYSSPEQILGTQPTPASDVYSLGVVLYEAFTGRLPFTSPNPISLAMQHVREEPVAPREVNSLLTLALDSIILRCLAKDAGLRYQSMGELREALIDVLEQTTSQSPVTIADLASARPKRGWMRLLARSQTNPTVRTQGRLRDRWALPWRRPDNRPSQLVVRRRKS